MAGHAQWELDKDAAIIALERRLALVQIPEPRASQNNVAVNAPVGAAPERSLLLSLQAPTKLYPADASYSNAASRTGTFRESNAPSLTASLKWSATMSHQQAAGSSSSHTSKRTSTGDIGSSKSAAVSHAELGARQLPPPQQAAAVASWKPPARNTAARLGASYTPASTSTAGGRSTCSQHSRPLQLHKQQERDHNKGVLLMERRLAQLSQALKEAQALQEQYAQQLADANAANKQRVGNIEVGG